ncbi:phosphate ABC transporter membrane protein 1, PhoT family [Desulfocapsa sulfexigens DSM 10523]|uniref:Phosphate ABC transporter membrane protein 1, PhoT family n=1 Tax=Desulfocapsa sulfexigens (strain DSM 10523 / SB164P1) TaxID=1167006 RepID=M1NEI2_DESSD|nr:ABC transporter permease subunit [Desulfocapsa sulfexigens]AGF78114.1 phosphate ABC transporter membrane protein 1, PhoT family [Desulfocapsa sulfexigens DSM 10523]
MRLPTYSVSEYLFLAAAVFSGLLAVAIFCFLFFFGLPLLQSGQLVDLLFSSWAPDKGLYGIYPMLITSLTLATVSMLISFPVSLGCSFVITSLAPVRLRRVLLAVIRVMTGIPTVVYSFAALFLLVPLMRSLVGHGTGMSILTAAPVLALVIAPTMILFFVDSFSKVSSRFTLAVDALGGSEIQKLLYVILPLAWPGIVNGVLLGFGRAMGDTMVSLMLAGNSTAAPESMTESARTLTAHIALVMAFDFDSMEFKSIFVCGLFLYILTAALMLLFRMFTVYFSERT